MYIAIYNRYSPVSSIVPSEIFTLDIRTVSEQTASEAIHSDFLIGECAHWSTARCPNSYRLDFG